MAVKCAAKDLPVLYLYNVEPDWSKADAGAAIAANEKMAVALQEAGHPVQCAELAHSNLSDLLSSYSSRDPIVFNQCESLPGIPHSEPDVVRIIEALGFIYTGSTPEVIRLAGDKAECQRILEAHQIPTPAWRVYREPAADDWSIFPAIVKTTREHCSLGLDPESVVLDNRELQARIAYVLNNFDQAALVEDFIDGREFHVPVWGNGKLAMLPVVEMDFSAFRDVHDRLCTYDSKFSPESRHYHAIESVIPAKLGADELQALERICLATYRAFGCRDYARLDIRKRDGQFYVLDVNPNADLDQEASIACAAAHLGMAYPDMMSHLVRLAARRHPRFVKRRQPAPARAARKAGKAQPSLVPVF